MPNRFQVERLEDRFALDAGDHNHIPIDYLGGKIYVEPAAHGLVFPGIVDTFGGGYSLDPSLVDMHDPFGAGTVSHLIAGDVISYSTLGPLRVHDGTNFVSAAGASVSFLVPFGATVTGSSGLQGPFTYGTVETGGLLHVHPLIQVSSPISAALGVQFELTTSRAGILKSDSFWVVWDYDLAPTAMESALTAFANLSSLTADAGGPYSGPEGTAIPLTGSATGGATLYEWDFDSDGQYDDAVGASVNFLPSDNGVYSVGLRVTGPGGTATDTATVTVASVAPTAAIAGPGSAVRGQPRTFTLSATDPSLADQAAPFTFHIDWDGNGTTDQTVGGPSGATVEHVFATSGSVTVRVTATDKDGATSLATTKPVTVSDWSLQTDPVDPAKTNLVWGGTNGFDGFGFVPGAVLTLALNNQVFSTPLVTFTPAYNGKLIVYAQGSGDLLFADVMLANVALFGGDGDDVMVGGRGGDTLDGGAGNDILFGGTVSSDGADLLLGGAGDDLLIGHLGADTLQGGSGQDLLLPASVTFLGPDLPTATFSIQAEWLSARPMSQKVANLSGTGSGPRNNGNYFLVPHGTLVDDAAVDRVLGEADNDWLLYDFGEDLAPDVAAGDITTNVG